MMLNKIVCKLMMLNKIVCKGKQSDLVYLSVLYFLKVEVSIWNMLHKRKLCAPACSISAMQNPILFGKSLLHILSVTIKGANNALDKKSRRSSRVATRH
jgi:hypothetical protein